MTKQIKINNLLFEKIAFRYSFFSDQTMYGSKIKNKMFLDTFYPYTLALNIVIPGTEMKLASDKSDGFAISEQVSNELGVRKLHISELITMLGYTKTDITKLLQGVKNKTYNLTLVGLGGTGSNFLHWMYEMAEWTGKIEIFNKVTSFDDDDFDVPNMLRIPFVPQFNNEIQTSKKVRCIPSQFKIIARYFTLHEARLTHEDILSGSPGNPEKTIIYGAPDIETREWLSSSFYTFIAATHRDSEYSLVENPRVDNDLMMETYGKINLSKFFLNHLTMTIKFLEHLRDREIPFGTINEVNISHSNFDEAYPIHQGLKVGAKNLFIIDENITREQYLELEENNE